MVYTNAYATGTQLDFSLPQGEYYVLKDSYDESLNYKTPHRCSNINRNYGPKCQFIREGHCIPQHSRAKFYSRRFCKPSQRNNDICCLHHQCCIHSPHCNYHSHKKDLSEYSCCHCTINQKLEVENFECDCDHIDECEEYEDKYCCLHKKPESSKITINVAI